MAPRKDKWAGVHRREITVCVKRLAVRRTHPKKSRCTPLKEPLLFDMGNEDEEIEKMNYAVVNSDEISTVEKLEKYTGEIQWSFLKPHFEAGSLIWVSPELVLTEVGHAVAEDQSNRVESWKKEGLVLIPSEPHADYWESIDAAFRALVVSPFVLVQPLEL